MKITFIILCALFFSSCSETNINQKRNDQESFSFVFMTDIHLQPEHRYPDLPQSPDLSPHKAFSIAIDTANKLGADFVIMGGDQVYDVMRGQTRADSLFTSYKNAVSALDMPVHHTIGNHELFGIYEESSISTDHPDYKYGMFERYFGKTYYSFDHKGWHFIVLNTLDVSDKRYIGVLSEEQMNWLQKDLAKVDPETPIAVSTHLPLVSVQRQVYPTKRQIDNPMDQWIINRKEILDIFSGHNLKLVLQGHMHIMEHIYVYQSDVHFITGGSIAGRPSWKGFRNGEPSGFLLIKIMDQDISWDFIDFGWRDFVLNYKIEDFSINENISN